MRHIFSGSKLRRRDAMIGRLFCLPFYLGLLFFFIGPIYQSIRFSFSDVTLEVGRYALEPVGIGNYHAIFFEDLHYGTNLAKTLLDMLWRVPVILISSLFIAMLLNQKFRGRTLVRAICFLPVIVASGVILDTIRIDMIASSTMSGSTVASGTIFQSTALSDLLVEAGFSTQIVNLFTNISNNVFDVIYSGGIQMLLFLAGLQGIASSLYEAAEVEGATAWESFWKITLPLMTPVILINVVYTIVDCFTSSQNAVMQQVMTGLEILRFGESAAMLWVYCVLVLIVLGLVFLLFRRVTGDRERR